jgi:DNA-binding transcriptional ArsR family regulator
MNEHIDTTWQGRWGAKALSQGVTIIPTAFLKHAGRAGLNAAQQILLIHLISYWWAAGKDPFPSLATLRDRTGLSEKTIGQHLKKLEEKLWISRQRRFNKSNKYDLDRLARRVAWLAGDQTAMAREKFHPPEQQAPSKAVASSSPLPTPVVEQVREDRDGQTSGGPEPEEEEFHGPHGPSLDDMKKFMKEGE